MKKRHMRSGARPRFNKLTIALAIGLGFAGAAYGQATSGAIFGDAPGAAGQTVRVVSSTGVTRTTTVAADGSYALRQLPLGTYTVTLMKNGQPVSTQSNINLTVGAGSEVDFGGAGMNAQQLGTVQVTANAIPEIDVTTTASSTVITAQQLNRLPIGRSAEAIALLAPGVVSSSAYFGNALTVAGAGATENAYYVNGYNTTALYDYTGSSYQLPYGSIAQQETLVGGYGAKYGRADGGVISQVGKRGTNEWHYGAHFVWEPAYLSSDPRNTYYPDIALQPGEEFESSTRQPGDLYQYRHENKGWSTTLGGYVGGPIVQDKLFFFLSAETHETKDKHVYSVGTQQVDFYKSHDTKYYAKIDWNINDNNILEFTELKEHQKFNYGNSYVWDNDLLEAVGDPTPLTYGLYDHESRIFHYTGYLSDKATLSVLYGYTEVRNPSITPNASPYPQIRGASNQDPSITPVPITNSQNTLYVSLADRRTRSKSLRADFEYQLGDHLLQVGLDNLVYTGRDQGSQMSGPGWAWFYSQQSPPDEPINAGLHVGAPGGNGYFVYKYIFVTATSMSAEQKAWYLQDKWQVTPNLMFNIGIRNDHFTNKNAVGIAFVDEPDQWEPRLGFSWDVFGDSSFKVYGTAGRYYLAIPMSTGERAAGNSLYTLEYFTYTGIDENGIPTGLTPVPGINPATGEAEPPPGPVSSNGEFGQPVDPTTVTSTNLKPQYQDEFILGFDKSLGPNWTYGAKFTYRTVGTIIDDVCIVEPIVNKVAEMGYDPNDYAVFSPFCHIFNPNQTNVFNVWNNAHTEAIQVPVTQEEFGFPDAQRDYYGLNLYLSHPFDGTWAGRIDYTFARSWGNAEGQVRSDIGQTDVSVTEDWDYPALMSSARGYLANMRRHQLKAYGAWQVAPEWLLSGNLLVQSGMPKSCLGWYGPDQVNVGGPYGGGFYGSDYHWCRGEPSPPGQHFNPWTFRLDLGIEYRPAFADHKLGFRLDVFNVTDEQEVQQTNPNLYPRGAHTISNTYSLPVSYQTPRYVRFSISYDY
ncbi:MAG TPA: TonB-dependent receptor [Rhodanobacteraceae bacterium]|nr:TonB-dependent receptor [Rhodanobacteraceae bacterium]